MFSWVSSFFSNKKSNSFQLNGNLIRFREHHQPKMLSLDCLLKLEQGMNQDEYLIAVEDKEWDLDEHANISIVANPEQLPAICWNDGNSYMIFVLADPSQFDELISSIGYFLWRYTYHEDPEQSDMREMKQLIGEQSFPFDLETLEPLEQPETPPRKTTATSTMYPTVSPDQAEEDEASRYDDEEEIFSIQGELFLLETDTNEFVQRGEHFTLSIVRIGDASRFTTLLCIEAADGKRVISVPINSAMSMCILSDHNGITFNTLSSSVATWAFLFDENQGEELIRSAKKIVVQCIWESQYMKPFSKLNHDDQVYIYQSYIAGDDGADAGYESEDLMDIVDLDEEEEEVDDDEPQVITRAPSTTDGERNSLLVDSAKHDRAFVVRGDQIGIFNDEDAEYKGRIKVGLRPEQMMLHNNESRILMTHRGKVHALDLTKEKVVEEYHADTKIRNIGQVEKYAEQSNQPLFAAMSNNSLWAIDPRIQGKGQSINKETYKTNPKFSVFGTSSSGQLAVGSEDGIIRLYTGISGLQKVSGKGLNPKRAKTNLPGFGDDIIGIDVSGDGKWVLATCKSYLMVIPTEIEGRTGFEVRMGQNKPSPRRLQLLPKDVALLNGETNFTPAKFNTGADGETWVVTSTHNYIITWNFRRVRKNHIHDYVMKRMHDHISAEQFLAMQKNDYGANNAPIFVVLDNDVAIEKRFKKRENPFQQKPQW